MHRVDYQTPKFNGLVDDIFKNVDKYLPVALGVWGATQQPKTGGPAKGLAQITAFCNAVLDQLRQILQAARSLPQNEAIGAAQQLRAYLDDSGKVYQAKSGKDGKMLSDSKAAADTIISQIRAVYTNPAPVTGTTPSNTPLIDQITNSTPSVTPSISSALSGVNPTYLVYGGLALAGLYLLKKK